MSIFSIISSSLIRVKANPNSEWSCEATERLVGSLSCSRIEEWSTNSGRSDSSIGPRSSLEIGNFQIIPKSYQGFWMNIISNFSGNQAENLKYSSITCVCSGSCCRGIWGSSSANCFCSTLGSRCWWVVWSAHPKGGALIVNSAKNMWGETDGAVASYSSKTDIVVLVREVGIVNGCCGC